MKSFLAYVSMILDILKSFIIALIVILVSIFALIGILHNVLKIREIYKEDNTGYKNLVWVDKNRMNTQIVGEGEKTIVILSDFATPSPIIQYKTYVDRLSSSYKVVIVEYFGYGYSLSTNEDRNSSQIAHEVKTALEQCGINGSYTILANGYSSIYAFTYANLYPENIERLVVVDGIYPSSIKENYIKQYYKDKETNAVINSYFEITGYARILSYLKPDIFGIDKMKEYDFSETDISVYRKMIANRFCTKTMRNEIKKLIENIQALENYEYPDYLPVTQILSKEYVQEFQNYKKGKFINKDIEEYANDLITNSQIQETVIVEGSRNLNLSNPDAVVQKILAQ